MAAKYCKEEWKDIEGFEGRYRISNYGRVLSLCEYHGSTSRYLKQSAHTKDGYLSVGLVKDRKRHTKKVHRLVAEAFIPNPEQKQTVNHIDRVRTNNHISNLEWMTHQENVKHSAKTGSYSRSKLGSKNGKSKLTHDKVTEIKKRLSSGESMRSIAECFEVSQSSIYLIKIGKNWSHHA